MQKIRRVLFSLLFVLTAQCVAAQDHMTLKTGEVIEGKIAETKNLEEMISDNQAAMLKFNNTEKGKQWTPGSKKEEKFLAAMKEIIDLYNE